MVSSRLDKIREARGEVQSADAGMSTARNSAIDDIAMAEGLRFAPASPAEIEYHAATVVELRTCKGVRSAERYISDLGISKADRARIMGKADELLTKIAEEATETAKALSLARHDHIYEQAVKSEDTLGHALKAQAGIDRITGTNSTTDESEAITRGLLDVMKEVYKDAESEA